MTILDLNGNEMQQPAPMPEWHKDVRVNALMQWQGHWFEYLGIDPVNDPNVIFFKYKEPTKSTKRRKDATRN
jgi:hypothetical protein